MTGQDGSVVHFKIKKNTALRKLMSAYCERTVSLIQSVADCLNFELLVDEKNGLPLTQHYCIVPVERGGIGEFLF